MKILLISLVLLVVNISLLAQETEEVKALISEGIDANYHDIINYAVFALILRTSPAANGLTT